MDTQLRKKIIKETSDLVDKINALKEEEELENGPSSAVRQYLADNKRGLFKGKSLSKEKVEEFNETGEFIGKKLSI